MSKAFEKILDRLEEKLRKSEKRYYRYLDDSNLSCMFDRSDIEEKRVDTINEILEIVQEVAEEYNITNGDKIRYMNDEELAEFLVNFKNTYGDEYEGEMSCLDWLKSEAEN